MGSTKQTTHKAKKQHRCTWCGEPILIGESYIRWRYFGDAVGTVSMHKECESAQHSEWVATGENEFSCYDNERPIS